MENSCNHCFCHSTGGSCCDCGEMTPPVVCAICGHIGLTKSRIIGFRWFHIEDDFLCAACYDWAFRRLFLEG